MVVVGAPCRNQVAGMAQSREQLLAQALIAQAVIEAFDDAILQGIARFEVVQFDLPLFMPPQV